VCSLQVLFSSTKDKIFYPLLSLGAPSYSESPVKKHRRRSRVETPLLLLVYLGAPQQLLKVVAPSLLFVHGFTVGLGLPLDGS